MPAKKKKRHDAPFHTTDCVLGKVSLLKLQLAIRGANMNYVEFMLAQLKSKCQATGPK